MKQLTKTFELYLGKKAPALPKGVKEFLVKIAPWLTIIGVLLSIPGILVLMGLSAITMPFAGYYSMMRWGGGWSFGVLFVITTAVLEFLAIPGLFRRKARGWNYLYFAALINAVYGLLRFDLVSTIIGALISLYLLFQIKSYYK